MPWLFRDARNTATIAAKATARKAGNHKQWRPNAISCLYPPSMAIFRNITELELVPQHKGTAMEFAKRICAKLPALATHPKLRKGQSGPGYI